MATSYYGTVEGFLAYCLERNIAPTTTDPALIQAGQIVASEWLDAIYRRSFPGLKAGGREQEREWPRTGATDIYGYVIEGVPREMEYASYEANIRQLAQPGVLSLDYTPPKYKQASVSGAVSVTYATFDSVRDMQVKFARIDEILSAILSTYGSDGTGLTGRSNRV